MLRKPLPFSIHILSGHHFVHCLCQFPQITDLQNIAAQRSILRHIAVSVPHQWRFGVQPDRPRGAAGHVRKNIEPRVIVIVAPIAYDDERCSAVQRIHVLAVEIIQRPAEVCVVMSAGHTPQNGLDRFVSICAAEIFRNRFEVVNESKGMSLAHLSLQSEQKAQHQL